MSTLISALAARAAALGASVATTIPRSVDDGHVRAALLWAETAIDAAVGFAASQFFVVGVFYNATAARQHMLPNGAYVNAG
jgi:hypothetical protein